MEEACLESSCARGLWHISLRIMIEEGGWASDEEREMLPSVVFPLASQGWCCLWLWGLIFLGDSQPLFLRLLRRGYEIADAQRQKEQQQHEGTTAPVTKGLESKAGQETEVLRMWWRGREMTGIINWGILLNMKTHPLPWLLNEAIFYIYFY